MIYLYECIWNRGNFSWKCCLTSVWSHDDVIKWKHFPRYWPFVREIHRSPVNSPHKGQWRGALMFSFNCAWTDSWAYNGDAGDLRRYCAHYDVIVMWTLYYVLLWSGSGHTIDQSKQIPQCICTVSHNAQFLTEVCTCVHIFVTKWGIVRYLSDALRDLWDGSIGIILVQQSWGILFS